MDGPPQPRQMGWGTEASGNADIFANPDSQGPARAGRRAGGGGGGGGERYEILCESRVKALVQHQLNRTGNGRTPDTLRTKQAVVHSVLVLSFPTRQFQQQRENSDHFVCVRTTGPPVTSFPVLRDSTESLYVCSAVSPSVSSWVEPDWLGRLKTKRLHAARGPSENPLRGTSPTNLSHTLHTHCRDAGTSHMRGRHDDVTSDVRYQAYFASPH
eukprot:1094349-Prorocentrum_minimum.AAC.3